MSSTDVPSRSFVSGEYASAQDEEIKSKRIVITGGPGAGKTVISRHLATRYPRRFVLVPEAATQVYDALQTRWDRLDIAGRRDVQRKIYRLQVDQEDRTLAANPGKVLILDRGTIDGAAYWPEGPADYWRDVGSSLEVELRRYDAVIWMQTSAVLGLYDGDSSNPVRFEHPEAAIRSGELLMQLWAGHPRLRRVEAFVEMAHKFAAVERTLEEVLRK
ncbi:MAG TPA: ATP-binding protein [Tepidisphaeraceae bacterium]|nr:ATP-binding protein [Tepidisphaeraceae bacterium]